MDNFSTPLQPPLPSDTPGQMPTGLPPKHKIKSTPPKEIFKNTDIPEEQDQEIPALVEMPPQCDWHLGAMFTGNYPDPFSLPALHIAKQSIMHDAAAIINVAAQTMEEEPSANDDSTNL